MRFLFGVFILSLSGSGLAATIDFEGASSPLGTQYQEDGFTLSSQFMGVEGDTNLFWLGMDYSEYGIYTNRTLDLTSDAGAPFSLQSFDLDMHDCGCSSGQNFLEVTGQFASGGDISTTLGYDRFDGWVNYEFDSSWSGLTSVEFKAIDIPQCDLVWNEEISNYEVVFCRADDEWGQAWDPSIDNIVVATSAVPIPAAVYLFGSGLGLLGWFRRKKG